MPIVPTVLINGAEGIGTGWSTSVSSAHLAAHMGTGLRNLNTHIEGLRAHME